MPSGRCDVIPVSGRGLGKAAQAQPLVIKQRRFHNRNVSAGRFQPDQEIIQGNSTALLGLD